MEQVAAGRNPKIAVQRQFVPSDASAIMQRSSDEMQRLKTKQTMTDVPVCHATPWRPRCECIAGSVQLCTTNERFQISLEPNSAKKQREISYGLLGFAFKLSINACVEVTFSCDSPNAFLHWTKNQRA
jgi:hypothetical protein